MENTRNIINVVLKAVAVGMSVASIVMGFVAELDVDTHITFLGIGLAALAIASLQNEGE
jgi:hypothetical protein